LSDGFLLQHCTLRVRISDAGIVTSCLVWDSSLRLWRESVGCGGVGKLQLYKDVPLFWDAWDVEFYYESEPLSDVTCCDGVVVESGPLLCSVRFQAKIGLLSRAEVVYSLQADDPFFRMRFNVTWLESHSLLRVSFATSIDADEWLADSQFSVISRSSLRNTSWDRAKFEAAAHQWVAVREHGMMVAVLNDGCYGHSCLGGRLSSSLLRSPSHPDPAADRGAHTFNMAFLPSPHPAAIELVAAAARSFNAPVRVFNAESVSADDSAQLLPLQLGLVSTCSHVLVDTVKLPFDWAAAKMNCGSCTPLRASDGLGVTTPCSPAQPAPVSLQCMAGILSTDHVSADDATTSPAAFVTPPAHLTPTPVLAQYSTPSPLPSSDSAAPVWNQSANSFRTPPPGTRVIIVRAFEAAGGAAPSVCLRCSSR
jgi:hypothetical protein